MAALLLLSPHLDDAVLSLWHMLAGPGDATVVNVFAGVPSPGHAGDPWWDRLTGATDSGARTHERRAEDREALALAGTGRAAMTSTSWRASIAMRASRSSRWSSSQVHRLDDAAYARKLAAVRAYRTQVPALEAEFGLPSRPDVLRYEVGWLLP